MFVHALALTPHDRKSAIKKSNIFVKSKQNKKNALTREAGAHVGLFDPVTLPL
jgi:hypothetical protein